MRPLLALAFLPFTAGAVAALPLDCRFTAACVEAGLCTDIDRTARLLPAAPQVSGATPEDGALLEMEGARIAGRVSTLGPLRLFEGGTDDTRLILGIAADGAARLMAMEAAPLAVASWFGHCEEV